MIHYHVCRLDGFIWLYHCEYYCITFFRQASIGTVTNLIKAMSWDKWDFCDYNILFQLSREWMSQNTSIPYLGMQK